LEVPSTHLTNDLCFRPQNQRRVPYYTKKGPVTREMTGPKKQLSFTLPKLHIMVFTSTEKSRKKRQKIHAWIRKRISRLDFGFKHEGRPKHSNTNAAVLDRINNGGGWLDRLKNSDFDDHFNGSKTYYFTGNGSRQSDESLAMIDIDCHARGTHAGALAFAEHLRSNPLFGEHLYVETSTNGVGVHAYIVVEKGCASDRITNVALKVLDLYLKGLSYLGDFDIELVEIKGQCPELAWGRERGRLEKYQSGQLAKLPREALHRTDELMGTSKVHAARLERLGLDLAVMAGAAGVPIEIVEKIRSAAEHLAGCRSRPEHLEKLRQAMKEWAKWKTGRVEIPETSPDFLPIATERVMDRRANAKRVQGSTEAQMVSDEIAKQIRGKLMRFAKNWCNGGLAAGMRRRVIPMDVATLIALLAHTKDHPNADGSTPTAWMKLLWDDLHERGYIDRPWDHHRYKAAREFLSKMGWIIWKDENYVVGREIDGEFRKGRAAKWEATDYLRGLVEDEVEEAGDELSGSGKGERHIYGHNTMRFNLLTTPEYLRDEVQYWKSPQFAGCVGQTIRTAA
jgi:hypothetical protein